MCGPRHVAPGSISLCSTAIDFKIDSGSFQPWALVTTAVVIFACYVEFLHPGGHETFAVPMDAHVVLGGALSFLIVFRTDSAYSRWWEARCWWEQVISSCRSHATSVVSTLQTNEAKENVFTLLLAYIISFKAYLRDEKVVRDEMGPRMDWRLIRECNAAACPPLHALHKIQKIVRENLPLDDDTTEGDEAAINAAIFMESAALIRILVQAVGACERIKQTPMTYGYVATLRTFLIIWLGTLPIPLVGEYGWLAVPGVSVIAYLFFAIEQSVLRTQPCHDPISGL